MPGGAFGSFNRSMFTSEKRFEDYTVKGDDIDGSALSGNETSAGLLPQDDGTGSEVGGAVGIKNTSDANLTGQSLPVLQRNDGDNKMDVKSATTQASLNFLQFTLTVPGVPRLKPLKVIQIIIGDHIPGLTGPALMSSFEHIYDGSGWTTEIEARQTGGSASAVALS